MVTGHGLINGRPVFVFSQVRHNITMVTITVVTIVMVTIAIVTITIVTITTAPVIIGIITTVISVYISVYSGTSLLRTLWDFGFSPYYRGFLNSEVT